MIQARWEHVDLVNREWLIPAENAKNKKNHTVFLSDFALKQFKELRAISHWRAPRKTPSIPHTIR
ncbi:MAG: hypothetical protein B7X28_04150 [Halothiobacillus sp. 13-55-253]|nr:MAG: hypothetical protein B7X28_04150 [Halothiobacillus sp. 13-55-253]